MQAADGAKISWFLIGTKSKKQNMSAKSTTNALKRTKYNRYYSEVSFDFHLRRET